MASRLSIPAIMVALAGLAACGIVDPAPTASGFDLHGEVQLDGGSVTYQLFVTNQSIEPVEVTSGGCPGAIALVAYQGSELRWDERPWSTQLPCLGPTSSRVYAPGETVAIERVRSVHDILGDSLPEGTYRLAIVPLFAPLAGTGADADEVPLGSLHLAH